jgi:hypothetical protein
MAHVDPTCGLCMKECVYLYERDAGDKDRRCWTCLTSSERRYCTRVHTALAYRNPVFKEPLPLKPRATS